MLLSISAQLTDLPSLGGEAPPGTAFGPAAAGESVTFAELLRQPIPVRGPRPAAIATAGPVPALPAGGKSLPAAAGAAASTGGAPPLPAAEATIDEYGMPPAWPVESALHGDAGDAVVPPADAVDMADVAHQGLDPLIAGQALAMPATGSSSPARLAPSDALIPARAQQRQTTVAAGAHPAVAASVELSVLEPGKSDLADASEATMPQALPDTGVPVQAGKRAGPAVEAMLAALGRDASAAADRFDHVLAAASAQPAPGSAATAPGAAPAAPQPFTSTSIAVPFGEPAWADALGDQVLVLTGKQVQRAEIRLYPGELGPVQVRITVEEDGTTLAFTAQNAVTREAIEQALPRLRELFSDQGLSLLDTSVSEQGGRQEREARFGRGEPQPAADPALADDSDPGVPARATVSARQGLIDTFA